MLKSPKQMTLIEIEMVLASESETEGAERAYLQDCIYALDAYLVAWQSRLLAYVRAKEIERVKESSTPSKRESNRLERSAMRECCVLKICGCEEFKPCIHDDESDTLLS